MKILGIRPHTFQPAFQHACLAVGVLVLGLSPLVAARESHAQGFLFTPEEDYQSIETYSADDHSIPAVPPRAERSMQQSAPTPPAVLRSIDGAFRSRGFSQDRSAPAPRAAESVPDVAAIPELPKRYELTEYTPPPGQQRFNDCVGWAVAYATYSCQLGQSRRRKPTHSSDLFSPAFIYNQIKIGNNEGCYLFHRTFPNAIDLVIRHGCASQATMPYPGDDPEGWKNPPPPAAMQEASNFTAIQHRRATSLSDIKHAIYQHHPVVMSIYMDDRFKDTQDKSVYRWSGDKSQGHAVCAIGYDDDREALLVINSWGTEWKNDGYCWVSYKNLRRIGRAFWCVEAHIIKVGTPGMPIVAQTNSRNFSLSFDQAIYERNRRISPLGWRFVDLVCTGDSLFGLRDDGGVYLLEADRGDTNIWINLSLAPLRFGLDGKKVTMITVHDQRLMALTDQGEVYDYVIHRGNDRYWVRSPLPDGVRVIDLRLVDSTPRITSDRGIVYGLDHDGQWTSPDFSLN